MDRELRHQIGQLLLAGFPEQTGDGQARRLAREYQVGNFILFAHNLSTPEQGAALCAQLSRLAYDQTGVAPLIAADQEGGPVCRITAGAGRFPGAMALAASASPEEVEQMGEICGRLLRAMGVNLNLAPVLDVNLEPMNPVIGNRSYGDQPERVARLGCAMMEGLTRGGVLATVKHYPGHGCVQTDSHLDLPVNHKTLAQLEESELIPFREAVRRGADAVMSCHIRFPKIDPELPATLSPAILTGLLREKLGFDGLVVTDCLEMDAIRKGWGTAQGAVLAIEAGCDLLCISHHMEAAAQAAEAICQAVEQGRISRERIRQSYQRVLRAKEKLGLEGPQAISPEKAKAAAEDPQAVSFCRQLARRSITLLRDDGGLAALKAARRGLVLAPLSRAGTQVQSQEQSGLSFANIAGEALGFDWADIPREPSPEETAALAEKAGGYDCLVLGVFNARFRPGQRALIDALCQKLPVVAVLLGEPYDLPALNAARAVIAAYEYHPLSARAAAEALKDGTFFGKAPIQLE